MIKVKNLAKHFGAHQAVRDVSFHVDKGEILGFLGVNGAGKTTTMRVLTGFYPPTRGSAKVDGLEVFENSLAVRKKIGYLPENVPLYLEMTVTAYLNFVAESKGLSRSQRKSDLARVMADCRIESVSGRMIKKLSKGYRQRVGLAQALLGDPEILILDEPTIGLDPRQIKEIRSMIKGFAGRKTIILSTHILPEVSMTCDRVAIINQGRVLAEDSPENLCAEMPGAGKILLKVSASPEEVKNRLTQLPGINSVSGPIGDGAVLIDADGQAAEQISRTALNAGWTIYKLNNLTPSLEDVFIRLVTADEEAPENV